jgi:Tol biopolymer transport system component
MTGGPATVLVPARVAAIAVASSGGRILYQLKMTNGRFDIFVMNANGSSKRNVTRTKSISETQPTWRSKSLIGFARKASRWAVFAMPVSGGRQTQVTPTKMNCQQPAYSANGTRLACVTRLTSTRSIIRTMTSRGLNVRTLFTRSIAPSQPVWANNTRVTYTAN